MQSIKYSWKMFIFSTWTYEFVIPNWDHADLVWKRSPMAGDILKEISKDLTLGDHIFMHNDDVFLVTVRGNNVYVCHKHSRWTHNFAHSF